MMFFFSFALLKLQSLVVTASRLKALHVLVELFHMCCVYSIQQKWINTNAQEKVAVLMQVCENASSVRRGNTRSGASGKRQSGENGPILEECLPNT